MKLNKNKTGQIALIMILLSAAALIFLSITLNWGRVAQIKTMVSIAADEAAAMLASDAASYGEMEKQTNLNDTNEISDLSGIIMDLIMVVVAIVVLVITICSMGTGSAAMVCLVMAIIAVIAAVAVLVLQLTVIQPGMCALWNKLQKNQPIQQQFFEGAVGAALQGATTDQVNLTDYFDENTNGSMGLKGVVANDSVSRFGFFYTERLKMLNKADNPYIGFFYSQLSTFMGGDTCAGNYADTKSTDGVTSATGVPLNPSCIDPSTDKDYCYTDPSDPACSGPVPTTITCSQNAYEHQLDPSIPLDRACPLNCYPYPPSNALCQTMVANQFSFQLNDSCTDTGSGGGNYNPYCDPCCQPMAVLVKAGNPAQYKALRPSNCYPYTQGYPTACAKNLGAKDSSGHLLCNTTDLDNAGFSAPSQCTTNAPSQFGSTYPFLYDPAYQQYANQKSFLDQYGRDQQMGPFLSATGTSAMAPETQGNPANKVYFPNGIYPFFWMMDYYSPQVDNISYTTLTSAQAHWCANTIFAPYPADVLAAFPTLTALTLPYACVGTDCCTNLLKDSTFSVSGSTKLSTAIAIHIGTTGTGPTVTSVTMSGTGPYLPGDSMTLTADAEETSTGGSVSSISFTINRETPTVGPLLPIDSSGYAYIPAPPATPLTLQGGFAVPNPPCHGTTLILTGTYKIIATATDPGGNTGTRSKTISIKTDGVACLKAVTGSVIPCGVDICGNSCGPACNYGETCTIVAPATTSGKCECSDTNLVPNKDDCNQCGDVCANGTTCHIPTPGQPGNCLCNDSTAPGPTNDNDCGVCQKKCTAPKTCQSGTCQ